MVDDQILLPDRREAIAAVLADAFGKAGNERREFQVGPIERDQTRQFVQTEHAVDQHDAGREHVDVAGDELAQALGHAGFDLQADDRTAPAQLQRALIEANEVLGLFLDFDVAVANDPETALPDDLIAGE